MSPVLDFADLPVALAGSNEGRTVSRSFVILTLIIERRGGVVDVYVELFFAVLQANFQIQRPEEIEDPVRQRGQPITLLTTPCVSRKKSGKTRETGKVMG